MKIEFGCLALVINSHAEENIGKIVTVGNFVGEIPGIQNNDLWQVDKGMRATGGVYDGQLIYFQSESYLMRIDGFKEEIKTSEKELVK